MRRLPLTAIAVVLTASSAFASTPDGETPSVETVCDIYDGAAFGLCNAYCEAMDCDHPDVRASNKACETVAANFTKKTGEALLPCDDVSTECTVDAVDDYIELNYEGDWSDELLGNDAMSPAEATLEVTSSTAPADVAVGADGTVSGTWPVGEEDYLKEFEYTACCDAETCDTASVVVMGVLLGC